MLLIIGYIIVVGSALTGFILAGGNPVLLLHVSEFVVIIGVGVGVMVISSSSAVLKAIINDILGCLKGGSVSKKLITDLMKLLYELFMVSRKDGIIALDEHMSEPSKSRIFVKYPAVLQRKKLINFIVNAFQPLIDGRIKQEQVGSLLESELDAIEDCGNQPVSVLSLVGDSLPGIGIVAAVLGIINTMSSVADGPEKVGEKVAAALTGTFLGVIGAYGFVNPLTKRIQTNHRSEQMLLQITAVAITENLKGTTPLMAIECARRCLDEDLQPDPNELETMLKEAVKK